jgi:hypothetical protein
MQVVLDDHLQSHLVHHLYRRYDSLLSVEGFVEA